MASWRTLVRVGLAIFLVVFGVTVYVAFGPRPTRRPVAPIERLDPAARSETTAARLERVRGDEQEFEVSADTTLSYEDGSVKQTGVRITARNRGGRDFVVRAREARSGPNELALELIGDVSLSASDGFELTSDRATFDRSEGVVTAPGEVSFRNGARLSGFGVGMHYDQRGDVLTVPERATITVTDSAGLVTSEFSAGSAVLDRARDLLVLNSDVRATHGEQVMRGREAIVHLSSAEEFITAIELKGEASVDGGRAADALTAREIDLGYSADGAVLERLALRGSGSATMPLTRQSGQRKLLGESLELRLAPDGSVVGATGSGGVRLDEPASDQVSGRRITSRSLDATGRPGVGLTDARFGEDVEYRERRRGAETDRTVRSRALRATMDEGVVTNALFSGDVTFDGGDLTARAMEVRYQPNDGTLVLTGVGRGGEPHVEDARLTIDAQRIDLDLDTRHVDAQGAVKTTLRPDTGKGKTGGTKPLPRLLRADRAVGVNADRLTYRGESGSTLYDGHASLWQEDVAIWGDSIHIEPEAGTLRVAGSAKTSLRSGEDVSKGTADVIRYDDGTRRLLYLTALEASPTPTPAAPRPETFAQLNAAAGEIRARRIEVLLTQDASRTERIEAHRDVTLRVGRRVATGARLNYFADDERYVMSGAAGAPVVVVEPCREITGNTLTFYKGVDTIVVDGDRRTRVQTKNDGRCPSTGAQ